jgi:glutamate--cysteine ligase catalytic subunit
VEYILVKFDHEKKTARVSLRAEEILNVLREKELENPE